MLTDISAMIINQALNSVGMSIVEIAIFPLFNLLAIIPLIVLLRNTKGKSEEDEGVFAQS
jgi:hypothetical protein